jgi:TolB-like protein/DNA-binding winged helix-turn-helix (wHTH) protein/tetratricopeptide (TPR) repeat protein
MRCQDVVQFVDIVRRRPDRRAKIAEDRRKFSEERMEPASQAPPPGDRKLQVADRVIDFGHEVLLDVEGKAVELRPQAYQVLRHLALNPGRVVSKDELLAAVWPNVVVTDDSLVQAIGDARRSLGAAGHEVLKTVPKRGYVLVASGVGPVAAPSPSSPSSGSAASSASLAAVGRSRRWPVAVGGVLTLLALATMLWTTRSWQSAEADGALRRPSIAVLSFRDPQRDPDGELLARSFAEDLVSELARGPEMRVVSHQSSFQFAGSGAALGEIGRRLRSRYLVDGTVQREGQQLRILVQLLDSEDGRVVWSSLQAVGREALPSVRRELAARIAGTLLSKVRSTEERRALQRPPSTLDVMVLTEHGKSAMVRYSADGIRNARKFYEQALAIDPDYAPAWANLGIANTVDIGLRITGEWNRDRLPEVLVQVRRAISLDPELAIGWVALAQAQALARDYPAAMASARRCFDVSPNDADCFYILGKAELESGDPKAAIQLIEEALDRNPMPPTYLPAFYATALWANRRFDETLRVADECLSRAPAFWRCRQDRIVTLVEQGRQRDAEDEAERLLAQTPGMKAEHFAVFAASSAALRDRRVAAARAAGVPAMPASAPR